MNTKGNENTRRLRYIRVLEKFFYSIVNYLQKSENPTKEGFVKKVLNGKRGLDKYEPVPLYKEELLQLEELTDKILAFSNDETKIEDIKAVILQGTNQLEKNRNRKKYKKDKHANKKFEDY